jgi:hypothetical protein
MWLVCYALAAIQGVDTAHLGHPNWEVRERAESRLRALGFLAVPMLLSASESGLPETRERCRRLLMPWRSWCADLAAARILTDPWPADARAFWRNPALRVRVHRMALGANCPEWMTRSLHPKSDEYAWLWCTQPPWSAVGADLERCKRHMGLIPSWLFK